MEPVILVHGGAGDTPDSRVVSKTTGCKNAALEGYKVFTSGGSALDAVEAAVRLLEDDPSFNAGYGSSLNINGEVEMDASIMVGSDLRAGAVTLLKDVAHPISVARLVMEKTRHVSLGGDGCKKFAIQNGVEVLPPESLVTEFEKEALEYFKECGENYGDDYTNIRKHKNGIGGTVGAVAIDSNGLVAVATSTGGTCGKLPGRCSDSSQIGNGSYADNRYGAVSCTGFGEAIIRKCLAHSIIKAIESGKTAQQATTDCVNALTKDINKTAGAITVSNTGEVGIYFTTDRMVWAYCSKSELHYGLEPNEHKIEIL